VRLDVGPERPAGLWPFRRKDPGDNATTRTIPAILEKFSVSPNHQDGDNGLVIAL
jgi:hypothetical protein